MSNRFFISFLCFFANEAEPKRPASSRSKKMNATFSRWFSGSSHIISISRVTPEVLSFAVFLFAGPTKSSKTPEEKGQLLSELVEKTWCKFEGGEMKLKIYKTFPIEEADEAQQVLYRGENVGKVVLTVKEGAFEVC